MDSLENPRLRTGSAVPSRRRCRPQGAYTPTERLGQLDAPPLKGNPGEPRTSDTTQGARTSTVEERRAPTRLITASGKGSVVRTEPEQCPTRSAIPAQTGIRSTQRTRSLLSQSGRHRSAHASVASAHCGDEAVLTSALRVRGRGSSPYKPLRTPAARNAPFSAAS